MASTPEQSYTECYVGYYDVLGFKELVNRSASDPTILKQLVMTLNEAFNVEPPEKWKWDPITGGQKQWRMQVRSFSDNIVFFVPVASGLLTSLLESSFYLYHRLLEMGCCLRGGITVGDMYWNDAWSEDRVEEKKATSSQTSDEVRVEYEKFAVTDAPITLGPGIIEAYFLESQQALVPRLLISDTLLQHIKQIDADEDRKTIPASPLCSSSPSNSSLLIGDFIRTDFDGRHFLDILHPAIDRAHVNSRVRSVLSDGRTEVRNIFNDQSRKEWLEHIRNMIVVQLSEASSETIACKYLWWAEYFNWSFSREADIGKNVGHIDLKAFNL